MTKAQQQDKLDAIEYLRKHIKPGDRVYTTLTHVSRSGMSRSIKVCIVVGDEIVDISGWVGRALDEPRDHKRGGVKVGGCGMDMGFHVVYCLGRALFPDGFRCCGERCQSHDHNNPPHPKRDGRTMHKGDSVYALRQEWI